MKKYLLSAIVIFATIQMYGQECGDYIDIFGVGIYGEKTATIDIPDWEDVEYILAEAIYKSETEPFLPGGDPVPVLFSTPSPNVQVENGTPLLLYNSGTPISYLSYVFRAEFLNPAPSVSIVIPEDVEGFYSFALYVYREDGRIYSIKSGEMAHVYHNGPAGYDTRIEIPESDNSRDIQLRFGITELNHDERIAIFSFWADGVMKEEKEILTWNPGDDNSLTGSYIIEQVDLYDIPGDVDEITMTMLSKNIAGDLPRGGDSFIAGVVLADLPCEDYESELLCSFTQGFYGNAGGKYCGEMTTSELLGELLTEELVMGMRGDQPDPGNSFTINKGDVDCVLRLLPGGGPSRVLVGDASCEDEASYESNKQGRLKNTLLSQGITLALNTRLSSKLLVFPVDGTEFVTMRALDCMDPDAGGIPGTEMTHAFSPEIVDALPADATIADLLDLVNAALAGEDISPLSLSQVADAAGLVNEAFDECVVVMGYAEITPVDEESGETVDQKEVANPEAKKGLTGVSDNDEEVLGIYPNPVTDHFYMDIPSGIEDVRQAAIYGMTGVKVMDIEQSIQQGSNQAIEINVSHLNEGVYFIRVDLAKGSITRRFAIQ